MARRLPDDASLSSGAHSRPGGIGRRTMKARPWPRSFETHSRSAKLL